MKMYILAGLVLVITAINLNVCSGRIPWKVMKPKQPALCYDCDYDPDDAQVEDKSNRGGYGWEMTTKAADDGKTRDNRRGFPRCALDSGDERFVRLTECHSNVCFIRRDSNGLVYRGCADPRNLPLNVDSSVQCREQGRLPAVWWFCNSTLCNSEKFSTVCSTDSSNGNSGYGGSGCVPHASSSTGSTSHQSQQPGYGSQQTFQTHSGGSGGGYGDNHSPPSSQQHPHPPPHYTPPQPEPSGYGSSSESNGETSWSYQEQDDATKSDHQSSSDGDDDVAYNTWDFLILAKSRFQRLSDWARSDSQDWSADQGNGGSYYSDDASDQTTSSSGYGTTNGDELEENPCDHKCVDNPSALFVDPSRPNGFIQCGPGVDYEAGLVCHCCLPYRLTCPSGAHFDPTAKVCTNGKTTGSGNGDKNGAVHEYVH